MRVKTLGKSVKFNPLCMQGVCKHKYMRNIQMNRYTHTSMYSSRRILLSLGGNISYHPKEEKNPDSEVEKRIKTLEEERKVIKDVTKKFVNVFSM